jgi:alpha-1,2-mannosyltransferase
MPSTDTGRTSQGRPERPGRPAADGAQASQTRQAGQTSQTGQARSARASNGHPGGPPGGGQAHSRLGRVVRALLRPRWVVWPVTAVAWAAAIALISYMVYRALTNPGHLRMPDLHVYRNGGLAVLHGNPLYSTLTNGKLLFTYPPLSAVLAVPLTWVSLHAAQILWLPMIYVPLAVVIWYAFRPMLARAGRYAPATFAVLVLCFTLIEPLRQEIHYGQIDIFLVALCTVDCLARRTWWPRGALIGLATAIKLVPGVFIVYLLVTGRRKAAAVGAVSFAAWTGLTWLIDPASSHFYWTSAIFDSRRLGQNAQAANQSLRAILLRAFFPAPPPAALWIGVALVVAVAGFAAARQVQRRGFEMGGLAITGLLAALLSPVAWVHHYCWIILAIGAIAGNCRSERRVIAAIIAGGLFTSVMPIFGGYLYFTRTIPAFPALIMEDAFGLAALALIWIIFRIRVRKADRLVPPTWPAAPARPDSDGEPQVMAGNPKG